MARTEFQFIAPGTTRQALFERKLLTTRRVPVRAEPKTDAEELLTIDPKSTLQAVDMDGSWFRILLDDARVGYVESSMVHVIPGSIDADAGEVKLRAGPGKHNDVVVTMTEGGTFKVLDMRFIAHSGFWYKVNTGEREAWMPSGHARPHLTFPVVYFLTGLERFSSVRYREAASYLKRFVSATLAEPSKANLSAAHQLMGAARMVGSSVLVLDEKALGPFDKAVELDPEDPTGYLLRCVASLGILRQPERPLDDLRRALELDRPDGRARHLLVSIEKAVPSRVGEQTGLGEAVDVIQKLKADHGIN
jgi:hypothetical protein